VRASTFWPRVFTRALSRSATLVYSTKIALIPSKRHRTRVFSPLFSVGPAGSPLRTQLDR
jgi:hypothetical protein